MGSGSYKEVLTNIKIDIFKEYHPEDKRTENDHVYIIEELERTPKGVLPHLRSFRLKEVLSFICAITNSLVSIVH
jgi:hypothetical protein